ncbi:MAG: DNA-dependent RNA polymerase auxiliary subunit epsilon family protein [Streptococcaceae bacterium]|jgi:DNA-dependent RNA polymerase auxiliary subunit epsilon|nr:DNA-dependent RNA polymerase auxiliary subunit epsilon family protein [Streptococcaceae bacterium]
MLFKVFYQEDKDVTPRRENTRTMYVEIDAKDKLDGTIKLRTLIAEKTNHQIEFIDLLTDSAAAYEKETTNFELTEL